jgi:hypothetical protein
MVVVAKPLSRDKTVDLDGICVTLKMSKSTSYRYMAPNPGDGVDRDSRSGWWHTFSGTTTFLGIV